MQKLFLIFIFYCSYAYEQVLAISKTLTLCNFIFLKSGNESCHLLGHPQKCQNQHIQAVLQARVQKRKRREPDEALCKQLELLEAHWAETSKSFYKKLMSTTDLLKLLLTCCVGCQKNIGHTPCSIFTNNFVLFIVFTLIFQ